MVPWRKMGTRSLERVRVRCRVRCRVRGRVRGRVRPSAIIPSSNVQHNVREGTNVVEAKCARKGYRIRDAQRVIESEGTETRQRARCCLPCPKAR